MEDAMDVQCIMMSSMSLELQRYHENMNAREINQHLHELFQDSARVERYKTSRALFRIMLVEGNQVGFHVLKIISNLTAALFPLSPSPSNSKFSIFFFFEDLDVSSRRRPEKQSPTLAATAAAKAAADEEEGEQIVLFAAVSE
ncbi:hypothetical protein ZIOFF_005870 [Zingiber officinale]|uniref:Uncharacterized protein n=1 Tax=Zingiber officinale TaxID=94328 RepID=A0A8J5LV58_ZINOF|nr:hypothetical protein ZIOFF_005870 [Zingiber officinale]